MKEKKSSNKSSLIISLIAIGISILGIYFQFFNVKHTVLYSTLEPELNKKKKEIIVPIIFKNQGNQTEVILNSSLMLEIKRKDKSFYKRISSLSLKEYPLVLSPGDYKIIEMQGSLQEYLFGTYEISETEILKYYPITVFDSLSLVVNITYLTNSGLKAEENRMIGNVSFNEKEIVKKMNFEPIKLIKLDICTHNGETMGYSIVPIKFESKWEIDLNDTNSVNQNRDKILFIEKLLNDTLIAH